MVLSARDKFDGWFYTNGGGVYLDKKLICNGFDGRTNYDDRYAFIVVGQNPEILVGTNEPGNVKQARISFDGFTEIKESADVNLDFLIAVSDGLIAQISHQAERGGIGSVAARKLLRKVDDIVHGTFLDRRIPRASNTPAATTEVPVTGVSPVR